MQRITLPFKETHMTPTGSGPCNRCGCTMIGRLARRRLPTLDVLGMKGNTCRRTDLPSILLRSSMGMRGGWGMQTALAKRHTNAHTGICGCNVTGARVSTAIVVSTAVNETPTFKYALSATGLTSLAICVCFAGLPPVNRA